MLDRQTDRQTGRQTSLSLDNLNVKQKVSPICHPELVSGAFRVAQVSKMLKRVQHDKFWKRVAFTLAEVIIVLGIIGIVAEMTIPGLVGSYQEQACVTGLLKFHSNLQQAILMWKVDVGCGSDAYNCLKEQGLPSSDENYVWRDFNNSIGKYMKITDSRVFDYANLNWLPSDTLNYYGVKGGVDTLGMGGVSKNAWNMRGMGLLADGTTFSVWGESNFFEIWVDVNGKKAPNRIGKDTFRILVGAAPIDYNDNVIANRDIGYCAMMGDNGSDNDVNGKGLCSCWNASTCTSDKTNPTGIGAMPTSYVILNHKWPDFKALSKLLGPSTFKP